MRPCLFVLAVTRKIIEVEVYDGKMAAKCIKNPLKFPNIHISGGIFLKIQKVLVE